MSVKDDLVQISEALTNTLRACNEQLTAAAPDFSCLPECITQTASDAETAGFARGYGVGMADGEQNGFALGEEFGRQAERDEFWNSYQNNGVYQSCLYKFAGPSWTDKVYNPKYPLVVFQNALRMYSYSGVTDTKVDIDVSTIGGNAGYMFENSALVTIRKLKVSVTNTFNGCFTGCNNLQNIVFEGEIGNNIHLGECPLTRASIESVMSVLADSASARTLTLNKTAVEAAFTAEEWETLVATKPNWTIVLAA